MYGVDLDQKTKGLNEREPEETYAIWIRDGQEADNENANVSANQAQERGIKGSTLNEHLMHCFKFWKETGKHLNQNSGTICSGSRYSDGGVPDVRWCNGKLSVGWCNPQYADSHWRVRTVVSS